MIPEMDKDVIKKWLLLNIRFNTDKLAVNYWYTVHHLIP